MRRQSRSHQQEGDPEILEAEYRNIFEANWVFLCHEAHVPKPVDEARVVSPGCLSLAAPDAVGDPVTLTLPTDACRLFGPDVAQPAPGAPPTRPPIR